MTLSYSPYVEDLAHRRGEYEKPKRGRPGGRLHRRAGWLSPAALTLAMLLLCASAAQAKVVIGMEDWGLGGSVKSGLWAPLYVELKSTGEDFVGLLEVEVRADQRVRPLFTKPITLVRDTPTQHWLYFRSPSSTSRQRSGEEFAWQVRNRKGRVVFRSRWQRPMLLPAGDTVVTVFRGPGVSGAGLGGLLDPGSGVRNNVLLLTPKTAPDNSIGYQGSDVLVWLDPDPSQMSSVAQREALVNYVNQGGHLVLAAGTGWQALTGSFLSELLPARPTGTDPPVGEVFDLVAEPSAAPGDVADWSLGKDTVLVRLEDPRGEVLMAHRGAPVIVRAPVGLGRVTLIAFDPTKSPFTEADPEAKRAFWTTALGISVTSRDPLDLGTVEQVSEPLIRALNDFPGFKPINFTFIILFLLGYVILIGPADYFILKRLKRLHWTWVTFPTVAIFASVLAFWLLSSERVRGLLANSISVVDASADSDRIAGTTFMTFLSPKQTRYTVSLAPGVVGAVAPREFQVWGSTQGLTMTASTCRVYGAGEAIDRLLVRIWDAQTIEACWRTQAPRLPTAELRLKAGRLQGTVTNSTPDTLGDVVVLFADEAIRLGTLRPRQSMDVLGRRSGPIRGYVNSLRSSQRKEPFSYYSRPTAPDREGADSAARWASLFGFQSEGGPRFCRWVLIGERDRLGPGAGGGKLTESAVFDLAANLQLAEPTSTAEAVVLYSVDRSFADILLSNRRPQAWHRSVVRLRVPVLEVEDTLRR